MGLFKRQSEPSSVKGHHMPAPRITGAGFWFAVKYLICPFLFALLLIDVVLWFILDRFFDSCYGVLCLIG